MEWPGDKIPKAALESEGIDKERLPSIEDRLAEQEAVLRENLEALEENARLLKEISGKEVSGPVRELLSNVYQRFEKISNTLLGVATMTGIVTALGDLDRSLLMLRQAAEGSVPLALGIATVALLTAKFLKENKEAASSRQLRRRPSA